MPQVAGRYVGVALLTAIVVLTLATGYIHFWIGGTMLLLNAAGYATLAVLVTGAAIFYRRALPLLLVALAGYAAVTILGWVVMGPYFDVAYIAKGIEIALIAAIGLRLWLTRTEVRESITWGLSLLGGSYRMIKRRPAADPAMAAADRSADG